MNTAILNKILNKWFDNGQFVTSRDNSYEQERFVGFHDGRTSELLMNDGRDEITIFQIDDGNSYLNAFCSDHNEQMKLIGMFNSGHDFNFTLHRNCSECHTTIIMIK